MAESFSPEMVAACGLFCGACYARLKRKTVCPGCRSLTVDLSKSMARCRMKFCGQRNGRFCFDCAVFPCDALKHLDKRYRTRYNLSPIANLVFIQDHGLEAFLQQQRGTWLADGGIICMHDGLLYPAR